jgi:hypothetical protein
MIEKVGWKLLAVPTRPDQRDENECMETSKQFELMKSSWKRMDLVLNTTALEGHPPGELSHAGGVAGNEEG